MADSALNNDVKYLVRWFRSSHATSQTGLPVSSPVVAMLLLMLSLLWAETFRLFPVIPSLSTALFVKLSVVFPVLSTACAGLYSSLVCVVCGECSECVRSRAGCWSCGRGAKKKSLVECGSGRGPVGAFALPRAPVRVCECVRPGAGGAES